MDFQGNQNYVQQPYIMTTPPAPKKRSGGAIVVNVFLYIFTVFFSLLFILVLVCKSFFTEETALGISKSLPLYSVRPDIDGESFSNIIYEGLDSLSELPLQSLDIEPTKVDHFLRESDFEGFMADYIYAFMEAFKNGTNQVPSFEDSFFDYLSENRNLLSSNLGIDITEQQIRDLETQISNRLDEVDDALSGVTSVTQVAAYRFFSSLISSAVLITLGFLVAVCLLLIWLCNSRKWDSFLIQTGSILMINGVVAWILCSIMELLTETEETGLFESIMSSMHTTLESTLVVGLVVGFAGIVVGVILRKRQQKATTY